MINSFSKTANKQLTDISYAMRLTIDQLQIPFFLEQSNISDNNNDNQSKKVYTKRPNGHKRATCLNFAAKCNYNETTRGIHVPCCAERL